MSSWKNRDKFNKMSVRRSNWTRALFELMNSPHGTLRRSTTSAPHVRSGDSVRSIYRHFVMASIPAMLMWVWNIGFQTSRASSETGLDPVSGWRALLLDVFGFVGPMGSFWHTVLVGLLYFMPLFLAAWLTVMFWETVFAASRRRPVDDGWFMHCWLFVLLLPTGLSLPQAAAGMSFGVVFGKHIFGGSGKYLVSPALLGVLFLLISYPASFPGEQAGLPAAGTATQTAWALLAGGGVEAAASANISWWQVFFGKEISTFGSTSAVACLLGVAWLVYVGAASWRIVTGALLGMVLATIVVNTAVTVDPAWHIPWHWHLALGSFAFAIAFLATDPSTTAITGAGRWLQGGLLGTLTILMRVLDPSHPESTLFAVLLAALFAPLIDHFVVRMHVRRRAHRIGGPV